jgi:hypothetical protein
MRVRELTVVVRIKPGEERPLRGVLEEVGAHPETNRYIRLNETKGTHLANWVILNDPDNGCRLFFASNYDGELSAYVDELLKAGPGIDEIFGRCEGYTGRKHFLQFVKKNSYRSQTFFVGFQTDSVEKVRAKIAIRQSIESFLDMPDVAAFVNRGGLKNFLDLIEIVAQPHRGVGLGRAGRWLWQKLHDGFFALLLALARAYGDFRVDKHCVSVASSLDPKLPLAPSTLSDADHMTNLIDVKPGFRIILWLSLAFMDILARYAFPPGELAGVRTIHFARWALIDGGRRLLFQSRFDGTWENYMGDFVDNIAWGLDAIWTNTAGYPTAGMVDIDAFKRFIRDRQFEHIAIYEAYPMESVLNQMRDTEIGAALGGCYDPKALRDWLQLI